MFLVAREPDAGNRIELLQQSYDKYTVRGALESRLALEATTAYLELDEPELAAYFLSQALECADSRIVSDHFLCPIEWDMVDSLLDTARVTEEELDMAREALRVRGFLPEPETAPGFTTSTNSGTGTAVPIDGSR